MRDHYGLDERLRRVEEKLRGLDDGLERLRRLVVALDQRTSSTGSVTPETEAPPVPTWGPWGVCGCSSVTRKTIRVTAFGQTKPMNTSTFGATFTVDRTRFGSVVGTIDVTVKIVSSPCTVQVMWNYPGYGWNFRDFYLSSSAIEVVACKPFHLRTTSAVLSKPPLESRWISPVPTVITFLEDS